MRRKKLLSTLQRKRQLNRQQSKMINRRQEYFIQTLVEAKEFE